MEKQIELVTQSEYARLCGKSRFIINYYVRKEYLETQLVSGVPHIVVPKDQIETLRDNTTDKDEKLRIAWKFNKA